MMIYQHPFGQDIDGVWVEPIRWKFYQQYEKASLFVARYELRNNKIYDCIEACTAILNIDPCQEDAHLLIIKAYIKNNDFVNARRQFILCKKNLNSILNMDISRKTKTVIQSLFTQEVNDE